MRNAQSENKVKRLRGEALFRVTPTKKRKTMTAIQTVLQKTAQTEQGIVREHLVFQALSKISRYQAECALFERKYGRPLSAMQQSTAAQTEDFSLEDDLLDWEYADSALQWWQSCLQEFQRAA
jgi:hypothetical protein